MAQGRLETASTAPQKPRRVVSLVRPRMLETALTAPQNVVLKNPSEVGLEGQERTTTPLVLLHHRSNRWFKHT